MNIETFAFKVSADSHRNVGAIAIQNPICLTTKGPYGK